MRTMHRALLVVGAMVSVIGSEAAVAHATGPAANAVATIQEFSLPGTDNLFPAEITMGGDGNLWFTEDYNPAITRITPSGQVTAFTVPTYRVEALTTGPDGAIWFTTYEGNVGRMAVDGTITNTFAVSSSPIGDITTGPDGNLWISGGPITRMTPSGVITQFAVPNGGGAATFANGPDGNLWFTDPIDGFTTARIGRITMSGDVVEYPVPPNVNGHTSPVRITAGPDGNLWFTDAFDQIGKVNPATGVMTMFTVGNETPGPTIPWGITAGPDGNVWYTVYQRAVIFRIQPDGTRTPFPLPAPYDGPEAITRGPHNTMWFTEHGSNGVGANRIGYIKVCGATHGCTL